jgi:hypothetical protein
MGKRGKGGFYRIEEDGAGNKMDIDGYGDGLDGRGEVRGVGRLREGRKAGWEIIVTHLRFRFQKSQNGG